MISLNSDWTFSATRDDLELGYSGENKVCTLQVHISGTEYGNWTFFADAFLDDKKDIWAVDVETSGSDLMLSIPILQSYIPQGGNVVLQLRAASLDGRIKKSEKLRLSAKTSINASDIALSLMPSEFEAYEERIVIARNAALEASNRAGQSKQAAVDAVEQCAQILEDVKASDTWREFGATPCVFSISPFGEIKLKSNAQSCSYHAYSDTVKDMSTQSRSYSGGITEDTSKGYYEYTLSSTATAWYNVYMRMIYTGLEVGKEYKIFVDTTGLKPGSTTATMLFGQFLLAESADGKKGNQILAPTRISSAGLNSYIFTPTTTDVMLEYYPGNVTAELVAGYQFRIRDLYINHASAGDAHTPIYDKQGAFAGETILIDTPVPVNFEAEPSCSVWYSKPISNVFTINGVSPDTDGNVALPEPPVSRLAGRTLVCFGDSITGMFSPPTDYPSAIARLTGMTVYNLGMEGCRMSQHPDQYYDAWSMYRLADAIASGDYSLQEASIGHTGSYAASRVNTLKSIDWSKVDYVTIFYGTNDIQGYADLDNVSNLHDTTTYLGAARYSLEKLWQAYPHLKVLLLTPMYRYWDDTQTDSDEKTFSGGRHFYEFGDELLQVAGTYKIPAVDLYRTLGINKFNRTHYFPANDGTHPNEAGRELLGNKIAAKLLSEY